jgi:hypothetical protein
MKRRKQPVPLIVQANKQDDPEAMPPDKLRKKLRVGPDVPIISSKAIDGSGVRETLATAMRIGIGTIAGVEILPEKVAFFDGDTLFDHVLTFEDRADDKEPVDVEELYIGAEEVEVDHQAVAGHLQAQSLDALEARAKRAAKKQETEAPADEPEEAVARRKSGGPKRAEKKRG